MKKPTKYEKLRTRVQVLEANPDRDVAAQLVEELRPKAAGGKRYRVLLQRARKASRLDDREPKERVERFSAERAGLGMAKSPKFMGGRELPGGLPGSKR